MYLEILNLEKNSSTCRNMSTSAHTGATLYHTGNLKQYLNQKPHTHDLSQVKLQLRLSWKLEFLLSGLQ